ncbi:competence protein ComK [Alkalicoccus daliensis]|uniref:Competence protein ComK n=1 Tax=Alkalicoccus daliensis TaxID=745820 RepID=A0A1H0J5K5_9BACI|nr:competence protein ComK [Alkalicoccus daliensis]SDO39027.1 competence protein ComK [Alkalicoccus daliensis]
MKTTTEYRISSDTMMLEPARQIDGGTIVHEVNRTFHVSQEPKDIIHANCYLGSSSYEGRVKAVRKFLMYLKRTPVLVYEKTGIITFPTHASNHLNCHWIFPAHIRTFQKSPTKPGVTCLFMMNGQVLEVPVSEHTVSKQYYRTNHVLRFFADGS